MTYENATKSRVLSSMVWKLLERGGTQGIQFWVQIVLARLLLPEDYGLVALVVIFLVFARIFVQSGLYTALVQKKEANETDFSSVFYLCLGIAALLYLLLFLAAPFIAGFYEEPGLVPVLRVLALTLFLGAVNSVQSAVVARRMEFKKFFFSSLGAITVSGSLGIFLAARGYGIWALVSHQLVNQLAITIILWFTVRWRPRLLFSLERVRGLFSFGWKLLASSLIHTLQMDLRSLIIGKLYNTEMLGFYNRGKQFPALIVDNINGSIQSVMLPTLASHQDDRRRVKDMMRRSIVTSSFLILPMMFGLAVVAEPLVLILLTEKWLPAVPFLQIYCAAYALQPVHTANLQAVNALGRSDIYLKIEGAKAFLSLAILGITLFYGVYAIALGGVASSFLATAIHAYPNVTLLNYSLKEQWLDVLPSLVLSVAMGAAVYPIKFLGLEAWATLSLQVAAGTLLYFGAAWLLRLECVMYLIDTVKGLLRRKVGGGYPAP